MRRRVIGLAVLMTGCAGVAAGPPLDEPATTATSTSTTGNRVVADALAELRVVDDRGQIVEIDAGESYPPVPGLLGLDGHTVVGTKGNHVFWLDPNNAARDARVEGPTGDKIADGELVPLVTDTAGDWVALGPPTREAAAGTIAAGRTTTELAVVRQAGDVVSVELDGNFVPEAFSLEPDDGAAPRLYVLEYLPADAPTHYRVRRLDPNTGDLSWPLNLRNKRLSVDTEMAGISRDQVVSSGRALLFTLYRGHHRETEGAYAFIHVLSMWGGVWCLEVPAELDLARQPGVVAVSPDESTLYAVSANGFVAMYRIDDILDPQRSPAATRVVRAGSKAQGRPVAAVTDEHVVIGQDGAVTWFDRRRLRPAGQAAAHGTIDAIAVASDGHIIVAADGELGVAVAGTPIRPTIGLPATAGAVVRIAPG